MIINDFWDYPQQILIEMVKSNKKKKKNSEKNLEQGNISTTDDASSSLDLLPININILKCIQLTYWIKSGIIKC